MIPENFDQMTPKQKRRIMRRFARDLFLKTCVKDDALHLWRVRIPWVDLNMMINIRQRHWIERSWNLEPFLDGLLHG